MAPSFRKTYGLLESVGRASDSGDGDYWLVDDHDWTAKQHKLRIFRESFLTPTLVEEIQKILKTSAPGWEVHIALELGGIGYIGSPAGLVVTAEMAQTIIPHRHGRAR